MSASSRCPHPPESVQFHLNHCSFGDTNLRYVEITARCLVCEAPVRFRGAPLGSSPDHPAMAPDGSEMRLPYLLGDEELTGKPIGFGIKGGPV